jgi:hypothetical protein
MKGYSKGKAVMSHVECDFSQMISFHKPLWHDCIEFCNKHNILVTLGKPDNFSTLTTLDEWEDAQIFLMNQRWSKVIPEEVGHIKNEEVRFPADICVYEFKLPACHICYLVEATDTACHNVAFLRQPYGEWTGIGMTDDMHDKTIATFALLWHEVKSMLVALDAEVVETEVIRAPVRLNKKRIKKGKTPLKDYNVIKLSNRHRIINPHDSEPSGRRHRLHFRRGHWRHYHDHKTWIKWQLVGDPSLGFVDKHYEA